MINRFTVALSALLLVANDFNGQVAFEKKNPEEQYADISKLIQAGSYSEARQLSFDVLDSLPNYHDLTLVVARTYMWQKQFDSASIYINKVLEQDPQNVDAKEAQFDWAYFTNDAVGVEKMAPSLIHLQPNRIDYREKYALALETNQKQNMAIAQADTLLQLSPNNAIALDILNRLQNATEPKPKPLELSLGYSFDHFSLPYTRWWHLYTTGLYKPMKWGSLEGRVNMGHLNASGDVDEISTEFQVEAESYLNLTPVSYSMVGYGFSPSPYNHFPRHKAVAEIWHKLPAAFIVSLGAKYYYWDDHIFLGTASLEKYWKRYWFCFRTYAFFKETGVSESFYFTARRYFNEIDYFQLTLGTGTAPDEPYDIKTDLERLSATSVRCAYVKVLSPKWKLKTGVGYGYEEYYDGMYRNRFDGYLSFVYSFLR